jgi:hypothetical protein
MEQFLLPLLSLLSVSICTLVWWWVGLLLSGKRGATISLCLLAHNPEPDLLFWS